MKSLSPGNVTRCFTFYTMAATSTVREFGIEFKAVDDLCERLSRFHISDATEATVCFTPVAWHLFQLLSDEGKKAVLRGYDDDDEVVLIHPYHIMLLASDEFIARDLKSDPVYVEHMREVCRTAVTAYESETRSTIRHLLTYVPEGRFGELKHTFAEKADLACKWWEKDGKIVYRGVAYPYPVNLEMMESVTAVRDNIQADICGASREQHAFEDVIGKLMSHRHAFAAEYYKDRTAELKAFMEARNKERSE